MKRHTVIFFLCVLISSFTGLGAAGSDYSGEKERRAKVFGRASELLDSGRNDSAARYLMKRLESGPGGRNAE